MIAHLERPAAGKPERALVLFHGRGADERDLYPSSTRSTRSGDCSGSRRAARSRCRPAAPTGIPLGGIPTPDPATFGPTFAAASAWLDVLPIPLERTVLGGFSQAR
ncbi:MAG: hypothetical protein MSC30_16980 [Gaiellaceae bacterium MAG52_C11]|nr:hypothetical protein [Candidatus Gaiellasilicea maunaloa]